MLSNPTRGIPRLPCRVTALAFVFFAAVAIGPGAVLSEIKMGALVTVAGGLIALGVARVGG